MRFLLNLALFFTSMWLGFQGIGALLPPYRVPTVTPKLEWMQEHGDEYDTLFLGTSRTFRQIIPEIFEQEMAAGGVPLRAFNLGVDGMRPPEDTYVLEKALALRTKPVRLVLVECNPIRLTQREDDRDSVRAVYWHDWTRMVTLYRRAFLSDTKKRNWKTRYRRISREWPDFKEHTKYWFWNNSNLGRGHEVLFDWLGLSIQKPLGADLGTRLDGFRPGRDGGITDPAQKADYEAKLAALLAKPPRPDLGDPVSREELRVKARLVEKAGGRMILVVPPVVGELNLTLTGDEQMPPILNFSNPKEYPELFLPENRADSGHTNAAGALLYTRLIVSKLIPLLKTPASP